MDKSTVRSQHPCPCTSDTCSSSNTLRTLAAVASPAGFEQAANLASARLPNRRIEHGVVQRKNVDWVSFQDPWNCSSSHGYVRWIGKRGVSLRV